MLLIKKTISLANQPPLSEADLGERALDWLEEIENIIPVEQLRPAFSLALKKHDSTFPINVFEVLQAYREIETTERIESGRIEAENRAVNRVAYCPDKHNHQSETEALQEYQVGGEWQWLPCAICRADAYWLRVKEIKSKIKSEKSNEDILLEQNPEAAKILKLVK